MPWGLTDAVGLTNAGTQCANHAADQQQVAELLDAVGLPAGGTSLDSLPPIGEDIASPEFCDAISGFQDIQGLVSDSRVDVDGATWQRLIELVDPGNSPPGGSPLLLVASSFEVIELPQNASGMPSLIYTVRGPVASFDGPGVHIELSVNGPLKVAWGDAFPIACELDPDMAALEQAVNSGDARSVGGVALDQLCSRLKVESRAAIGGLFAAITLRVTPDGSPLISGSIGDEDGFTSVAFDPVERAVLYSATRHIFKTAPVLGGDATVSGDIQLLMKVTGNDPDEASVAAALVVVAAGALVLLPVAEWVAGSELASGVGAGVRELLIRLFQVAAQ